MGLASHVDGNSPGKLAANQKDCPFQRGCGVVSAGWPLCVGAPEVGASPKDRPALNRNRGAHSQKKTRTDPHQQAVRAFAGIRDFTGKGGRTAAASRSGSLVRSWVGATWLATE